MKKMLPDNQNLFAVPKLLLFFQKAVPHIAPPSTGNGSQTNSEFAVVITDVGKFIQNFFLFKTISSETVSVIMVSLSFEQNNFVTFQECFNFVLPALPHALGKKF